MSLSDIFAVIWAFGFGGFLLFYLIACAISYQRRYKEWVATLDEHDKSVLAAYHSIPTFINPFKKRKKKDD